MTAFLRLIRATPGWRAARVWDDNGRQRIDYAPVVAWAEMEEHPGELMPLVRDGWCSQTVRPLGDDDRFLALLAPGDVIDIADGTWNHEIAAVLKRQAHSTGGGA